MHCDPFFVFKRISFVTSCKFLNLGIRSFWCGQRISNGEEFFHKMLWEVMKKMDPIFGILKGLLPHAFEGSCHSSGILESADECRWGEVPYF